MPPGRMAKRRPLPASSSGRARSIDPQRRANPGLVAVQRDDRLVVDAPHQAQLVFGDGGAKRGDGGGEAGLDQGDHVHIAFGDDQRLALAGSLARGGVVEQVAALVEKVGLGAVQIFGAGVGVHRPPAKADRRGRARRGSER